MYYFQNIERQNKLKEVMEPWIGTPFRHWSGVKQGGCDCIHFIVRVLEEMGLGPFKVPRYNKDWHLHNMDELLMDGIKSHLNIEEVSFDNPMNGDIMLFQFGKTNSHSAIYFDKHLYQAINGIGVERIHWMDTTWHKRKRLSMRIVE